MIKKITDADINQVARIHKRELEGFLSELGIEFLQKFYKVTLNIPEIFTFVKKEKGKVLGFITGIISSKGLYKKIILADPLGFGILILKSFITQPKTIWKTIKLLSYPGFSHDIPELLVIAVDRKFQRRGIGKELVGKLEQEFQRRKIREFQVSVYDRLSANKFYEKIGGKKILSFTFLNELMNYYLFHGEKKLRVILLTYDSLYANPVFFRLFDKDFIEIVAVVESDCIIQKKGKLSSLIYFYHKFGPVYFLFKVIDQALYLLFSFNSSGRLLDEAEKRGIPIFKMKNINDFKSRQILSSFHPDILISYFNQILSSEVLQIPYQGSINVHPGFLPLFRGVASSFWVMLTGSKFGGVTVHFMAEKLDTGDIMDQGRVPIIGKKISLHKHNYLCCELGGKLLVHTLKNIAEGKRQGRPQKKGNYYSWPNKKDVDKFLQKGFRLMDLQDLKLYFQKS